ncbi:alpha/beta fold hydrolase [Aquimonas sp.]|jgi:pimeloyl-ACP methyl ester carboxylesterase|uniref:alpha/beta fold hydrolase n=1 Tax=Aquimonas sp. TaxID=1872588 RepID=UPI0037BE97B0
MDSATPTLHLHWRAFGDPHAEHLLLVHGLGSSGADWAFQVGPLAEHFHVLVPDLPGAGRSPAPTQHSIAGYARALLAALDRAGIERVHLMGFSLGGAVALELALQAPARVRRLMTINSLPSYRADTWRKRWELHGQLSLVRVLGLRNTARMVATRLFPHAHQAAMRTRVVDVFGMQSKQNYLRQARALAAWCARARLDQLEVETLVLAAEHDYTPLAEKQAFAKRIGAQLVVVRGSRHGTPFDSISATNTAALAFFRGHALPEVLFSDKPESVPLSPPEILAALQ